MFEKHLWVSDKLSKDAGRWPASLLKMSLSHLFFKHFASKNQLPGLTVIGKLVENGLIILCQSTQTSSKVNGELSEKYQVYETSKGFTSSKMSLIIFSKSGNFPADIYLLKVNNWNTSTNTIEQKH